MNKHDLRDARLASQLIRREFLRLAGDTAGPSVLLAACGPTPGAPTLDPVKLVKYDRQWATDNKDRLIKKWQGVIGWTGKQGHR